MVMRNGKRDGKRPGSPGPAKNALKGRELPPSEIRADAAKAIGKIDDVSAVPALIEVLKDDRCVKHSAAEALANIGDASAFPALDAVGGYAVSYKGLEGGDAVFDIKCGATGEVIATDVAIPVGEALRLLKRDNDKKVTPPSADPCTTDATVTETTGDKRKSSGKDK